MSLNRPDNYSDIFLELASFRSSVTDISMDSNDTSPASILAKPANSYDDYEQNNRSTFSSDVSLHESILSSHSKEHAVERVTPRTSFTTVEEQHEYLRLDKNESASQFSDDADPTKSHGAYSSTLNSLLFPKIEPSLQEGIKYDRSSDVLLPDDFTVGQSPHRAQEYPSYFASGSKSSEKSILNILKAASEDAYESTNSFLSVRKAASEDAFEDNQVRRSLNSIMPI